MTANTSSDCTSNEITFGFFWHAYDWHTLNGKVGNALEIAEEMLYQFDVRNDVNSTHNSSSFNTFKFSVTRSWTDIEKNTLCSFTKVGRKFQLKVNDFAMTLTRTELKAAIAMHIIDAHFVDEMLD